MSPRNSTVLMPVTDGRRVVDRPKPQRCDVITQLGPQAPQGPTLSAWTPMVTVGLAILVTSAAKAAEELVLPRVVVTLIDQVEVPARDAGVLEAIALREGQTVRRGDQLGQLDGREALLLRQRAEADLEAVRQQAASEIKLRFSRNAAEVALAESRRAIESVEKFPRSVSQTELDRLKLLAEKARLEIEQAEVDRTQLQLQQTVKERDLQRARLIEDRRVLIAPIDGVVVQWKRQCGEWVEPGTPIVRVIRLDRLRAEGFATASELPLHAVGRPVQFTVTLSDGTLAHYAGTLTFVSPEISPVNGQARFWAEIENPAASLRPGQAGTLKILTARQVTAAPLSTNPSESAPSASTTPGVASPR